MTLPSMTGILAGEGGWGGRGGVRSSVIRQTLYDETSRLVYKKPSTKDAVTCSNLFRNLSSLWQWRFKTGYTLLHLVTSFIAQNNFDETVSATFFAKLHVFHDFVANTYRIRNVLLISVNNHIQYERPK